MAPFVALSQQLTFWLKSHEFRVVIINNLDCDTKVYRHNYTLYTSNKLSSIDGKFIKILKYSIKNKSSISIFIKQISKGLNF